MPTFVIVIWERGGEVDNVKRIIVSIVFSLMFILIIPITAFAHSDDTSYNGETDTWSPSYSAKMEFSNAPDGTAYMDILIKMDETDEDYVQFTSAVPYSDIDEDSEIAKLNDDGYISLSLHYKYTESLEIRHSKDEYDLLTVTRYNFLYINKNYGDFKVAYVDESGHVLGITNPAKTTYIEDESFAFLADGDSLVFIRDGSNPRNAPWFLLKILGIMLLIGVGFVVLIVLPFCSLARAFFTKT